MSILDRDINEVWIGAYGKARTRLILYPWTDWKSIGYLTNRSLLVRR